MIDLKQDGLSHMFRKYLFIFIATASILFPKTSNASPWRANDTKVEVRRDEYHGQHLYITFEEGPVKMLRASLPNDWKISEAKAIEDGFVLRIEGMPAMCYSSKSFGRVYSGTMMLKKDEDSKKAAIWEKNQVTCK